MRNAGSWVIVAALAMLIAAPALADDAARELDLRYRLKNRQPPPVPRSLDRDSAAKEPYPHRYYGDTSRGNLGCHRLGQRAIDTKNSNWWGRYRACTDAGD